MDLVKRSNKLRKQSISNLKSLAWPKVQTPGTAHDASPRHEGRSQSSSQSASPTSPNSQYLSSHTRGPSSATSTSNFASSPTSPTTSAGQDGQDRRHTATPSQGSAYHQEPTKPKAKSLSAAKPTPFATKVAARPPKLKLRLPPALDVEGIFADLYKEATRAEQMMESNSTAQALALTTAEESSPSRATRVPGKESVGHGGDDMRLRDARTATNATSMATAKSGVSGGSGKAVDGKSTDVSSMGKGREF